SPLEPAGPTTEFGTTATFHAVVALKDAPAGTLIRADWHHSDAGPGTPGSSYINSSERATSGTQNIDFTLRPASTWRRGKYRVEIFADGALARTAEFTVR